MEADVEALHEILVASIRAGGDEARAEAKTLVWFLRNVMAIEPLDAYEYVFDDNHLGVDGLLIQDAEDVEDPSTLFVFEVKTPRLGRSVGVPAVRQAVKARQTIEELSSTRGTDELSAALSRLRLHERLLKGELEPQAVLVSTGPLSAGALNEAREHNVRVFDLQFLGAVAKALEAEGLRKGTEHVVIGTDKRFVSNTTNGRIAVCAVPATQIANWKGIEDRSLFGLNVRRQLQQNRIRSGLTEAIESSNDQPNFLAYHNGLTVVCRCFDLHSDSLDVHDLSIVNGAQSVVALLESKSHLTDVLEMLVKFVEVGDDRQLPAEVARRSNTQTAVNPRNLRSLDGRQRFLVEDFKQNFPEYNYITRPDATLDRGSNPIANDVAAQLLCAVYAQRPWLAVKRTELFRAPTYSVVFPPKIKAANIVLCKRIRDAVQKRKSDFPSDYRRSWALTSLIATYLVSQILREDSKTQNWLSEPAATLKRSDLSSSLEGLVEFTSARLTIYHKWRVETDGFDNFKVDFKNKNSIRSLASDVVRSYLMEL